MEDHNKPFTGLQLFCFYFLWTIILLLIPFYGFGVLFEFSTIRDGDVGSYFSPLVGLLVTLGQIGLHVWCFVRIKRRQNSPSQLFLALIGGTITLGFVYFGGCTIMGPLRF